MEYDQILIIRFLWNDGIDVHEIIHRLQTQFNEHAYALRTVRFWIAEVRLGRQGLHDEIRTGRSPLDDLDTKILDILDKFSFKSTRSITEILNIVYSTLLLHLHNSIGFRSFHLHWLPHLLTHDLREKGKEYARAMLPFLHVAECDSWFHYVTGNEL
jgi:hypothetical protein